MPGYVDYILLKINCYSNTKYTCIHFSASNLFNQFKMTPPPSMLSKCLTLKYMYLLVTRWRRIQNSLLWGQYSTCPDHQKLRKNAYATLLRNDRGYSFNDSWFQFSTEKFLKYPRFNIQRLKWTPVPFSTRFKICNGKKWLP